MPSDDSVGDAREHRSWPVIARDRPRSDSQVRLARTRCAAPYRPRRHRRRTSPATDGIEWLESPIAAPTAALAATGSRPPGALPEASASIARSCDLRHCIAGWRPSAASTLTTVADANPPLAGRAFASNSRRSPALIRRRSACSHRRSCCPSSNSGAAGLAGSGRPPRRAAADQSSAAELEDLRLLARAGLALNLEPCGSVNGLGRAEQRGQQSRSRQARPRPIAEQLDRWLTLSGRSAVPR